MTSLLSPKIHMAAKYVLVGTQIILLCTPLIASADQGTSESEPVEIIVVTARQAAELEKDVPFSLSVIGGDQLQESRVMTLEDALRSTPGVMVYSSGDSNQSNIRIRGVGSLNPVSMDDGSVSLSVDDVFLSSRHSSLATLDTKQIEVLKGPQGTLFGRNSEAGAINVTTNKPTDYFEGHVRGEFGDNNQKLAEAVLNIPISDSVNTRLAVRRQSQDHWVDLADTGEPLTEIQDLAVRGSLLWQASEDTEIYFIGSNHKVENDVSLMVAMPFDDSPELDVTSGIFDDNKKDLSTYSLKVIHRLNTAQFESITAYTESDFQAAKAIDCNADPACRVVNENSLEKVMSQEVRLSSLDNSHLFWVGGFYIGQSERSFNSIYISSIYEQMRDYETLSYAGFGEVTYPVTDRVKVTGGLRYTVDSKKYDANYVNMTTTEDSRTINDDYFTGRTALSYALTPDINLYGVYARGYKSGGVSDYSTSVGDSEPYDAATVNSYEAGFKLESATQKYSLKGAVYFNDVKNDHLLGYDSDTYATSVINVNTQTHGMELEGAYPLVSGLTLHGGINYTDAEITEDAAGVSGGDVSAGNGVPDVAKWNAMLGIGYFKYLPDFWGISAPVLNSRLNWRYIGDRPADAQNHFDLEEYNKIDLRISIEFADAELYVWGDNLLDEQFALYGTEISPGVRIGAPSKSRSFGAGFNYNF
ncbi:TonB-dependent receptor [Aliivibrio fischeri]|nr:TonB-dependent receptor [Aliivibrio fischeri]GEK15650.1 TonB-dependent receptor [Aliivibrio fischeri]